MVIEEIPNPPIVRHYSDSGKPLLQVETGEVFYGEVVDAYPCKYTYIETEENKEE